MGIEVGARVYVDWPPHQQGPGRVELLHQEDRTAAVRMECDNQLRAASYSHLTPIPEEHTDAHQDLPQG